MFRSISGITSKVKMMLPTATGSSGLVCRSRLVFRHNTSGSRGNTGSLFLGSFLAVTTTAVMTLNILPLKKEKNCQCSGIIGVVGGPSYDARAVLINGLSVLKNHRYDSVGLATMRHDGKGYMAITKFASDLDAKNDSLELVRHKSLPSRAGHSMGIAHTRWATQGSKTDFNAHPHTDASGRIAVVHNGALYNADSLRTWLESKGIVFWGDTDSEVIAKLIGYVYYLEKDSNKTKRGLKEAVEKALLYCEGTWGLAVMCIDEPNKIVVAAHGSSLSIGLCKGDSSTEGAVLVSSDQQALFQYSESILPLEEGEVVEIDATGVAGHAKDDGLDSIFRGTPVGPPLSPLDAHKY